MSFSSNKAPGLDKVPMSVIKDALPCILPALTDIINCSLLTSEYPTLWKTAEVVPLLKDGDHEIADNNRPVSLLIAMAFHCRQNSKLLLNNQHCHTTFNLDLQHSTLPYSTSECTQINI